MSDIVLRPPRSEDGAALYRLIKQCPPLDPNSMYCNLLQCTHFAETSVAAFAGDELVGFISGYAIPGREETLFIWQVAVGEKARGQGLATRMIRHILDRDHRQPFEYIETTVTDDNAASWALFEGVAKKLATQLKRSVLFDRQRHFAGSHESEFLARIGPIETAD